MWVCVYVCACVYMCLCVRVCEQGGEVWVKGWVCLKSFYFGYYNCNLTIFLQALGLYALPCLHYYWFRLDLAMNNTTQFSLILPKCILLFRTKHANIRILLTAVYGGLIPLIIAANLLLITGIIKTKRSKFTLSLILFSTLFVSNLTFGVVEIPSKI